MPTLLEHGGNVALWAGWIMQMPAAYHQRNDDGSWSAWGTDWTVDGQIIEIGSDATGKSVSPENILGSDHKITLSGTGWIGHAEQLKETDNGKSVFRLSGSLAAENTMMSCWVSYFKEEQLSFAHEIIGAIVHHAPNAV